MNIVNLPQLKAKGKMPGIQISHFQTFDDDADTVVEIDISKKETPVPEHKIEENKTIFETMPKGNIPRRSLTLL